MLERIAINSEISKPKLALLMVVQLTPQYRVPVFVVVLSKICQSFRLQSHSPIAAMESGFMVLPSF